MRSMLYALMVGAMLVAGCATAGGSKGGDGLVGTWRGRDASPQTPFQFAAVTFAPDGTYTAHMRYGNEDRGDSGRWSVSQGTLTIGGGDDDRTYRVTQKGGELQVTDPDSGISITLDRLQ